jgi:hypothetical protein
MNIVVDPDGTVRCVYGEAIDVSHLGTVEIRRGSFVEPDDHGCWWADLSPVNGPRLGPFNRRSDALSAEVQWLDEHWLTPTPS